MTPEPNRTCVKNSLHPGILAPATRLATGSSRLLLDEAQLLHRRFPHHKLLHLAGDGHGEGIDEFDVAGYFVMRDLAFAEGLDLLGAGAFAGFELDPGAKLLAVFLIGHAHNLHRFHLGMAEEELLDLAGIDVLATADHHVLDAADDVEVPVLVHGGEVARMHPAGAVDRLRRALGIVPITEHHRIPTRAEFAGGPRRHDASLAIDDLHLDMGMD